MFEINQNYTLSTSFNDNVLILDNFLSNPDGLLDFLLSNVPEVLHKSKQQPSFNGKYFIDKRHQIKCNKIKSYHDEINKIIYNNFLVKDNRYMVANFLEDNIISNYMRFTHKKFNDYTKNYWWPHLDDGYNAILYLNKEGCSGTNIYKPLVEIEQFDEHFVPWCSKDDFMLLYNIKSSYNRLVIFDGSYFVHGMAIDDDRFFHTERLNLTSFFTKLLVKSIHL